MDVRLLVRLARIEGAMFFLAFSALLASAVAPNTDWRSFLFSGDIVAARGRVVNAEDRGWQEGNQTVTRVHFEFDRAGRRETGASHFVGNRPSIGDEVRVEWPSARPGLTRIEGGRTGPLHRGALAVLFFPLFVLMMTRARWTGASTVLRMFRDGVVAAKGEGPGLADPLSGEVLAPLDEMPGGVEVGMDGSWAIDSASRLIRPVILSTVGAGAVAWLAWTMFEMGNQ